MPLCLPESQLNCARRLPGTVGDTWESPVQDQAGHRYTVCTEKFSFALLKSFSLFVIRDIPFLGSPITFFDIPMRTDSG